MRKKLLVLFVTLLMVGVFGAVMVQSAPAGAVLEGDFEHQVVRAYFDDPAMIDTVAEWKEPWEVDLEAGYLVVDVTQVEYQMLLDLGFRVEVDLALTEEINRPRVPLPGQGGGIPGYPCYRTVEETFASAADMAANYPTLASWTDIGDSWDKVTPGGPDGYDMQVLRLTNQAIPGPKPVLYLFGAIHSREYATAEMVTRFAEYMLANYGIDPDITWLMDYHQLDMVLQANPDGRKFAEAGQFWRKNTNNADGCLTTYGVDLNRNFEFYWNSGGSSGNSCNETYRGSAAASEPETQTLQDYAYTIFPDQRADPITATAPITSTGIFLDIHAYGEDIRWPWGFTSDPPPNGDGIVTLARKMGYYSGYEPLQSTYTTSGTTKDFMYGEFGVPGYTIEMGNSFFQSCSYFESSVWPDVLPLIIQAAKSARYSYIIPAGPDSVNLTLSASTVVAGEPVDLTALVDDTRYNNSHGTEPTQNVVAAELYIDVPDWLAGATPIAMNAVDGAFDETSEDVAVTIDTSGLSSGNYMLYVRGQDADGNWGAYSAIYLEVIEQAPTAGFTVSSDHVGVGETIQFTNTSTGGNLSYEWDFDDGSPINNEENPSHAYLAPGAYTVTLTVSNGFGSDAYSLPIQVDAPPTAGFIASADHVGVGETIQFTNTSTGDNLSYEWDFDDGSPISNEENPSHAYQASGTYNVNLTVSNAAGSDAYSLPIQVDAQPTAGFIASADHVGVGETIQFTNTSSGDNLTFEWNFDDGSPVSNEENPSHAYQATGTYTVNLTVTNAAGSDSYSLPILVDAQPTAGFEASADHVGVGETIQFTNTSYGENLTFEWDFDDGTPVTNEENPSHAYQAAGTYTVNLTISNAAGSDSFSLPIQVDAQPTAGFTASAINVGVGQFIQFTNSSTGDNLSYAWDFGDGSPISSEENPSHAYLAAGLYEVTLTVSNAAGSDEFTLQIQVNVLLYLPVITTE